jgi:hypothetical protein
MVVIALPWESNGITKNTTDLARGEVAASTQTSTRTSTASGKHTIKKID